MIVERISNHFEIRTAERVGVFLRDANEKLSVLKHINQNSLFIMDQERDRALYLSKIYDRFYFSVISKSDKTLITVVFPTGKNRRLAMEKFEKTHEKNLTDEIVSCYVQWRGDKLSDSNLNIEPPKVFTNKGNPVPPKYVIVWGQEPKLAKWDGFVWTDSDGIELDPHLIWGWKEVRQYENEVKKLTKEK